MATNVLILTDDVVGERMAGPAIRAWNMAQELAKEHSVVLFSTQSATRRSTEFAVHSGSDREMKTEVENSDIVIVQGYTLAKHQWITQRGVRLVVDLYDPIHVELFEAEINGHVAEQEMALNRAIDALDIQMKFGDFFICASERQRDLWIGYLSAHRRINFRNYADDKTLRRLIDVVPFGVEDDPPPARRRVLRGVVAGIDEDDPILLWAGGVYNWFDPVTLIEAVHQLSDEFPNLRLVFMGTKHPLQDAVADHTLREAHAVADSLGLIGSNVFFLEGWVPYGDRSLYLGEADIGVSTHFINVETAYSFRTRILDYLWVGLPIVCTTGDEFARLIEMHGAGRVVPERDVPALAQEIRELWSDHVARADCSAASRALGEQYRWRETLAPLARYCRSPYPAADAHRVGSVSGVALRISSQARERTRWARAYLEINGAAHAARRGLERLVLPRSNPKKDRS